MKLSHARGLRGLQTLFAFLLGLVIISPILYGASLSVMSDSVINSYPPKLLPQGASLANYSQVIANIPIFRFIFNSVLVSAVVCAGQILICSMAAYTFVFFQFRGRNLLFLAVLATMMIPAEATFISNFLTISSLGLTDTYAALILPFMASAMGIFLIRQFYLTLPKELKEASLIDGASDTQFFLRILFPISTPVLGALGVYTVINTWNQYMWPLLVTNSPERRTVQIGISMLQFADGVSVGYVCAGCVLVLLPSILFFTLGQKKMVESLTAGSVKG